MFHRVSNKKICLTMLGTCLTVLYNCVWHCICSGQDGIPGSPGMHGLKGGPGEPGLPGRDGLEGNKVQYFTYSLKYSIISYPNKWIWLYKQTAIKWPPQQYD